MAEYDGGYKELFSHPEMVADLLRDFIREDWVRELDFSTLEKVPGSYVTPELSSCLWFSIMDTRSGAPLRRSPS